MIGVVFEPKRLQNSVFCTKKYRGQKSTFWNIWRKQVQMYPQTSIEPKHGVFNLNKEVKVHGLVLLVQLS